MSLVPSNGLRLFQIVIEIDENVSDYALILFPPFTTGTLVCDKVMQEVYYQRPASSGTAIPAPCVSAFPDEPWDTGKTSPAMRAAISSPWCSGNET